MQRRNRNRALPAVFVQTPQLVERPTQLSTESMLQQLARLLQSQQQPAAVPQPAKRNTLTVKEARTEIFENSISEYKLYEMVRKGEIPHVRIGAKILLRRDTLEAWMRQQEAQGSNASR
ncbi:helix-turn-helix domain-containing protein [Paenibacillus sp. FSL H8-0034]|uniref:helix-turn-helix domain-containing protein n=1 Tax=Paenibacillus sp. FSL H8-0034 TaxID=2954671 RepID=UPI0030F992A1